MSHLLRRRMMKSNEPIISLHWDENTKKLYYTRMSDTLIYSYDLVLKKEEAASIVNPHSHLEIIFIVPVNKVEGNKTFFAVATSVSFHAIVWDGVSPTAEFRYQYFYNHKLTGFHSHSRRKIIAAKDDHQILFFDALGGKKVLRYDLFTLTIDPLVAKNVLVCDHTPTGLCAKDGKIYYTTQISDENILIMYDTQALVVEELTSYEATLTSVGHPVCISPNGVLYITTYSQTMLRYDPETNQQQRLRTKTNQQIQIVTFIPGDSENICAVVRPSTPVVVGKTVEVTAGAVIEVLNLNSDFIVE